MSSSTESRKILITGATRGLGRALAVRFARLGHSVAACGRSEADLDSLAAEIGEEHPVHALDVTDVLQVEAWAGALLDRDWVPDLLLNNAGLLNRRAPFWEIPTREFDRVIDVNIKGVANVARTFLPSMIARGRGVVVNFSSGWGHATDAGITPYCASKFAIEGFTRALAHDLPPGLAAVPLSPGIIHTDMLETAFGDGAASHWKPDEWIDVAAPFLLQLGEKDNGRSQRIPGS